MKKIIFIIIAFTFIIQDLKAQEPFTHNLYTANPFLINPAATGADKVLTTFVDVYSQWTTFPEAPRNYSFGLNSLVTDKMGLGLYVYDDVRNYLNHLNAMIDYSYRIDFNKNSDLTFGIGFGIVHNNVNTNNMYVENQADPLFYNITDYNSTKIAAASGLTYRYKALQVQFSLPQMIEQGKNFASQYNLMAMYNYDLNSEFILKPSVLLRSFPENIIQLDGNLMAEYKKMFWVQLGYRTDKSLLTSIGLNWERMKLAYCFQANMGPLKILAATTNEIMLTYNFPDRLLAKKKSNIETPVLTKTNVSGTITNSLTNEPVVADVVFYDEKGVEVYKTKTNEKGQYVANLELGKVYKVEAKSSNYTSTYYQLDLRTETSKTYDASMKSTDIIYNLKTEPNATVKIYDDKGSLLFTGKSDAYGNYKVTLKPNKSYKTEVTVDNFLPGNENFTVPSNKQEYDQEVKLKGLVPLKANIKNQETGELVPATIKIKDKSGKEVFLKDTKGTIEDKIVEGDYTVNVSAEGFLSQKEDVKLTRANAKDFLLDIKVTPIAKDKSFKLGIINFATDKATIKEESLPILDKLVKIMKDNPEIRVSINGHTDNVGSDERNLKLSKERTKACVDYVVSKGISRNRLVANGFGSSKPLVPNDSPENRAKNRRVEFKVIE